MLFVGYYAKLFILGLAFRTFMPTVFQAFVVAYVDIFRWEKVGNFVEHIFEELYGGIISCAQNISVAATPLLKNFLWTTGASQLGI